MFEVREELHAIVAATATAPCVCRAGAVCIPCRARTLLAEISTRGIRIRRWRNDPANVPRLVAHIAGIVDVVREPRRSCPRYIVDRAQVCAACGEPLATGKWALFFIPGDVVVKLRLRDGSQDYSQPPRPGEEPITCTVLARNESEPVTASCYIHGVGCAMLTPMDHNQAVDKPIYRSAALAYGWTRVDGVVHLVLDELAIRSTIVELFQTGYSYREIAKFLNDAGYAGRNGSAWSAMVVQRIVVKPVPRQLLNLLAEQTCSVPLHAALIRTIEPKPVNKSGLLTKEEKKLLRKSLS